MLSTKCRQLENKNGNFQKMFPFLHRLDVKRGIPSPLHNLPMRVGTSPHGRRLVYRLDFWFGFFCRDLNLVFLRVALHQLFKLLGVELFEVDDIIVGIEGVGLQLDHGDGQVGAVVCHTLEVGKDIVEHKAL